MPSLIISKVSKDYGSVHALKNLNLSLQEPGCIGILGPNGAGKTTFFKILTNIAKPSHGIAYINGHNISDEPEKALSEVGALVEQPEFYPYLTALETLKFVCRIRGIPESSLLEEIKKVSKMTSIETYLDRKTGTFSRGMKQRLGLACALVNDPSILVLDEPTFGLDPKGMKQMRDLIMKLNLEKKRIILLSTHLIYEAQEVCDRILIMNSGEIVHDTQNKSETNFLEVEFDESPPELKILDNIAADYSINGNRATIIPKLGVNNSEIISSLVSSGVKIKWVRPQSELEGIYVKLVS